MLTVTVSTEACLKIKLPMTFAQCSEWRFVNLCALFATMKVIGLSNIDAGTIFRLGEQKLVKNNQDNQIQNITLCNMYFLEKYGAFTRIFVFKVTL